MRKVVFSLLNWPHAAVIYDSKGELWDLTANYRKNTLPNLCFRFAPAEGNKSKHLNAKFNPLSEVEYSILEEVAQAGSDTK